MRNKDLIAQLSKLDPELTVTIPAYEGGLDPVLGAVVTGTTGESTPQWGEYTPDNNAPEKVIWLYGEHRHHYLPDE